MKMFLERIDFALLSTLFVLFLIGTGDANRELSGGAKGGGGENSVTSKTTTSRPSLSSSVLLTKVVTSKPKFKGQMSNCASALDPCYFPRSNCCKWQSECPWDITVDDCKDDKDHFCCKYM